MITITTVLKTGNNYDYKWVDIMRASLARVVTTEYKFVPLSDANHNYPFKRFIQNNTGYWNKIELFRKDLFTSPVLFLDLDTVITGDLNNIIKDCKGSSFLMIRGNTTKKTPVPVSSSAIMYWESDMSFLWDIWNTKDSHIWYQMYSGGSQGDQAFIRDHAAHKHIQDVTDPSQFARDRRTWNDNVRLVTLGGPNRKPDKTDWDVVKKNWKL
jgi:hypothetical protein